MTAEEDARRQAADSERLRNALATAEKELERQAAESERLRNALATAEKEAERQTADGNRLEGRLDRVSVLNARLTQLASDYDDASLDSAPRGMNTNRLKAFSDGVFAIAITLLVLNLIVPGAMGSFVSGSAPDLSTVTKGDFFYGLEHEWPSYLALGVSFATIGVIWINHSWLFERINKINRLGLFLNLLVLIAIVLIPFTTAIMAAFLRSHTAQHSAAEVYIGSLLLMALAFTVLWVQCFHRLVWQVVLAPVVYVIALALVQVSVKISLILCLVLAAFYVHPFGRTASA